ncbi:hypothetical protein RHECNPAF_13300129 [Rhizobium etli CNPAF512]|nr:hypothetical protein RHECNPAF_13300129 [Rhizobium etli CNPAF512]
MNCIISGLAFSRCRVQVVADTYAGSERPL